MTATPAASVSKIAWTLFHDKSTRTKRELTQTWGELAQHLRVAGPFPSKAKCHWIKLARFGDTTTDSGALRNDANVLDVTGVEGDHDLETVEPEEAIRRLEAAGVRAIVYTSPSHRVVNPPKSRGGPRWRVLAPLSHPHPPEARAALLARVNGVLGGVLAPESFTLSQAYYYGRLTTPGAYQVLVTFDEPDAGQCVDELDELDEAAIGKQERQAARGPAGAPPSRRGVSFPDAQARVHALGRRLRTGDSRRALLMSYIASRSVRGFDALEVRALVDCFTATFFDPADPLDDTNVARIIEWATAGDAKEREALEARILVGDAPAGVSQRRPAPAAGAPAALPDEPPVCGWSFANFATLEADPPPARRWILERTLPACAVAALFGPGGVGKSLLVQQLATHIGHGVPFAGMATEQGPTLVLLCEDDTDEVRRRQVAIQRRLARPIGAAPIHVAARAGEDNLLVSFDRDQRLQYCPPWSDLVAAIERIRPVLVVIDNVAHVFGGLENDRRHVTQFANALTALARKYACAILLIGHVAKAEGSEFSGSTAWEAAVRTRLWLERKDDGMVVLHRRKANYADRGEVTLEWADGAFTLPAPQDRRALDRRAERAILNALATLTARKIATSHARSSASAYLPRVMEREDLLDGVPVDAVVRALNGLIDAGAIEPNAQLGWKKQDRHWASGLRVAGLPLGHPA